MNEIPVTGVIHNQSAMWLNEDLYNAINLDWEAHLAECSAEDHDCCWSNDGTDTLLIGFRECEVDRETTWFGKPDADGKRGYEPDPEARYSAIVGEAYTQVVVSLWTMLVRPCSPCYPGQGDLDSPDPEHGLVAYSLPPDLYEDEQEHGEIHAIGDSQHEYNHLNPAAD